jgi:hypothetical protein
MNTNNGLPVNPNADCWSINDLGSFDQVYSKWPEWPILLNHIFSLLNVSELYHVKRLYKKNIVLDDFCIYKKSEHPPFVVACFVYSIQLGSI